MSVAAAVPGAGPTVLTRRNVIVGVLLALAAAAGLFIASRPDIVNSIAHRFGSTVSQSVHDGVQGIKTVAAMMAERSPGERAQGALASLKHKRAPAIHERALPKVRRPAAPPISPLAAIVAGPPVPPAIPPAAPIYSLMTGPPTAIPPIGAIPVSGGGGPPIIGSPGGGGGGGGGVIVPPVTTTPGTPTPPTQTSAVPEPGTWALMLLGFGFVGLAVRRDRRRAAVAAAA
jgi:hypothetical protein